MTQREDLVRWLSAELERPVSPGATALTERVVSEVEVEIVPEVGHFTMLEAPAATNASIARFLARLGAAG